MEKVRPRGKVLIVPVSRRWEAETVRPQGSKASPPSQGAEFLAEEREILFQKKSWMVVEN